MPKRVTRNWLSRVAGGLTTGALALSLMSTGGGGVPGALARPVLADDIDCYNDKDLYNLPECVERRNLDRKSGNEPSESQAAPTSGPGSSESGDQQAGGGQQPGGGGDQQASGDQQPQASGGGQQPQTSGGGQQQASGGSADADADKPQPRGAATDPRSVVLTMADAGKEATQYINDEGSDKFGKWARTRFERDRSTGASTLGPNVMDSKVWITKDAETAKSLFQEQAAIKNFPERKEPSQGPVEKVKPTSFGEQFAFASGYYQDTNDKIWQHWRFVIRQGNAVAVVYLFGREAYFENRKDAKWETQGDYFTSTVASRM